MAFPRHPIIDVDPVEAVRGQAAQTVASTTADTFAPPSFGKSADPKNGPAHTTFVDGFGRPVTDESKASTPFTRAGGAAQTVAGAAVMAVGVPMLVLPGPGVLTIGAGAAIAAGGIKKMRNGK